MGIRGIDENTMLKGREKMLKSIHMPKSGDVVCDLKNKNHGIREERIVLKELSTLSTLKESGPQKDSDA